MKKETAIQLAKEYQKKYGGGGTITNEAKYYESIVFEEVSKDAWLVISKFEAIDSQEPKQIQFMVGCVEQEVVSVIGTTGFNSAPHLEETHNDPEWDAFVQEEIDRMKKDKNSLYHKLLKKYSK